MSIRSESLLNINPNKQDNRFTGNVKDKPISEYYSRLVFNDEAIKKYLMKEAYEGLRDAIETGQKLNAKTADYVAVGMRNWAIDHGATHFTHWFQPLTGRTAEKHGSFFKLDRHSNPIEAFSGKELIKQEPDGSSFPTGGLRETHRARSYTVWDPSSHAFIMEAKHGKTLCIPAIFISYEGDSLDLKTPLLKSIYALENAALEVERYFDPNVKKIVPTLGWEQEYFVVDEALYNARPDLLLCGRTLFGNASARGQQLDDHYFAQIPERVYDFMHDFENDCLTLGIPITTRHNEVAPNQFECAPNFETANIAADHNQLLMSIIDIVAKRHNLRAILHEKPFAGLNGSGKHNNWSMATTDGKNLLSPGANPQENLSFITFFINVIAAINNHAGLLRASISNAGNDYRLGANEAPPAIISVFTGDKLGDILNAFMNDKPYEASGNATINLNLERIANIERDETERNRTSPFPFTDNRFEFRAVGSSVNVSNPMTVLNTIVADQLVIFKERVEKAKGDFQNIEDAIKHVLRETLKESNNIIFNGNNYSEEWIAEAEKRGLPHIKSTPDAYDEYISEKTIALFERTKVFNRNELLARYNVAMEEYCAKIDIEARLVEEISKAHIIPACVQYQNKLISNVKGLSSIGLIDESEIQKDSIRDISHRLKLLNLYIVDLHKARKEAHAEHNLRKRGVAYANVVKPLFDKIRKEADALELIVDDRNWPLPKYRELLFLH
jgi:glutamine synthetase